EGNRIIAFLLRSTSTLTGFQTLQYLLDDLQVPALPRLRGLDLFYRLKHAGLLLLVCGEAIREVISHAGKLANIPLDTLDPLVIPSLYRLAIGFPLFIGIRTSFPLGELLALDSLDFSRVRA